MSDEIDPEDFHKVDEWGLPYFVDEWGLQTETDEEPPAFDSGGILYIPAGTITASKITAGSITTSSITVTPVEPLAGDDLAEFLSRTLSRKRP